VGLYLDTSPLQNDEHNRFAKNLFQLSQAAVIFHSSPARNAFVDNGFRDNGTPVRVEGGGDALGITWEGNDFDDYQGYDLDGDGLGDVPYELHDLSDDLVAHHPSLAFFDGEPVLWLASVAGHVVPLLTPRSLVVDQKPRVYRRGELARALEVPRAH
jgi:nitrous oxidase accessory protein